MARPKKNHVLLTDSELKQLQKIAKGKSTNQTIATRCLILIGLDENHKPILNYQQCKDSYGVSSTTISNTVKLYAEGGIDRVLKIKRNVNSDNANRKVDGRIEAKLIELACGPVPEGHSRWTIRLLEAEMKVLLDEPISREAIRRTLKKTNFDLTATTTGAYLQNQTQNS